MPETEVLLIESVPHAMGVLTASGVVPMRVVQAVGEHVSVVRVSEHRLDAVRGRPEVVAFTRHAEISEEALTGLTSAERLFVEAWQQAPVAERSRVGDGLSWDSIGYEAP